MHVVEAAHDARCAEVQVFDQTPCHMDRGYLPGPRVTDVKRALAPRHSKVRGTRGGYIR